MAAIVHSRIVRLQAIAPRTAAVNLQAGINIAAATLVAGTAAGTVVSNAALGAAESGALAGLAGKLNKAAGDILSGIVDVDTTTYTGAVRVGTVTWNATTGAVTGGSGVAMTRAGLLGVKAGVVTSSVTLAGDANYAGNIDTGGSARLRGGTPDYIGGWGTSGVLANDSLVSQYGVIATTTGAAALAGVIPTSGVAGGAGVMALNNATSGGYGVYAAANSGAYPAAQFKNLGGGAALDVHTGTLLMGNTTLVSNLNADMLHGYTDADFFRYTGATLGAIVCNYSVNVNSGGYSFRVPVALP